jgi:membrane associated rhomboid family serine protease
MLKPRSTVITLITVICAFYLWELLDSSIINTLALINIEYLRASNEWYRLFTVALLHDTSSSIPIHLAFNMMALHSLGSPIESLLGRTRFLIIFFVSLLAGSLTSAYSLGFYGYSIGASGAVFGLFGAFIALGRKVGTEIKGIIIIVLINFALGFTIGGVDWRAHLGGLAGGFLITKLLLVFNATK